MTETTETTMFHAAGGTITIHFIPNDKGNPPGKLADVELHWNGGILDGLKLIGFGLWERRTMRLPGASGFNLTFPARQYSVNGERRSYALLRPLTDPQAQETLRQAVINAWQCREADAAETTLSA